MPHDPLQIGHDPEKDKCKLLRSARSRLEVSWVQDSYLEGASLSHVNFEVFVHKQKQEGRDVKDDVWSSEGS